MVRELNRLFSGNSEGFNSNLFKSVYGVNYDDLNPKTGLSIEKFENISKALTEKEIKDERVFLFVPWYIHYNSGKMGTDHFGKHVTMDIGEHTNKYPEVAFKMYG